MRSELRFPGALVVGLLVWQLAAVGCKKTVPLGKQCPSPASGRASVVGDPEEVQPAYGTTCAPCDDGDEVELDADGCPVYVTFESCGGDVCLGPVRVPEPSLDAGMMTGDAAGDAATEDAAADEEDGGA
jgi:hypothetical protein